MWGWLKKNFKTIEKYPVSIAIVVTCIGAGWALYVYFKPVSQPLLSDGVITMSVMQFEQVTQDRIDRREVQLQNAHAEERARLGKEIADLRNQLADPQKALKEAKAQIESLIERLQREGDNIGAERLNAAITALNQLDYSQADAIFAEIEVNNAQAVKHAARAAYGRGDVAVAEVRWGDAAEHYARAARLYPSVINLSQAGTYLFKMARYAEAEQMHRESLKILRADLGDEHFMVAGVLNNLALVLDKIGGRTQEVEQMHREALKNQRVKLGNEHPDVASSLTNLGSLLETERWEEAELLLREALKIWRAKLGDDHPHVAAGLNNLANLLVATEREGEAELLLREAVGIQRAKLGNDHPDVAASLNNLGNLLRATNREYEAELLLREALKIQRAKWGNDHPDVAISLNNLGNLWGTTGRPLGAALLYRKALRIRRAKLGNDHPAVAVSLTGLAEALGGTGQVQEAEPLALEALAIFKKTRPEGHSDIAMVQKLLDDIRARLSHNQSAND